MFFDFPVSPGITRRRVRGDDLRLKLGRELALVANAAENHLATLFKLAQITKAFLEKSKLRVVEAARHFLAVASDEGHRAAVVKQADGRRNLSGTRLNVGGDDLENYLFSRGHGFPCKTTGTPRRPRCFAWKAMTTTEQIIFEIIAADIQARPAQVAAAVGLLDDGCTVPFVARYRKEVTGGLDDTQLRLLEERLGYLRELEKRREVILGSIRDQGKLTPELEAKIVAADTPPSDPRRNRKIKKQRQTACARYMNTSSKPRRS